MQHALRLLATTACAEREPVLEILSALSRRLRGCKAVIFRIQYVAVQMHILMSMLLQAFTPAHDWLGSIQQSR